MEVKALIEVKGKISYNQEDIEKGLTVLEAKYNGLVFSEEQVGEAKKERAALNKITKALAEYRKDIVEEAMADIKPFEDFMKVSEKRAKTISNNIDVQIKKFEDEQKQIRKETVKKYLAEICDFTPEYKEFIGEIDLDENVFTNAGSFNSKGEVGSKITEYVNTRILQFDEILEARAAQKKILQEKRVLIVKSCADYSEMLGLEIPLSPKTFGYLKDYDLSEISDEIKRAGQEQKQKENEAIERIRKQEEEKARKEAERKSKEAEEALKEKVEEVKVNTTVEKVEKNIEPEIVEQKQEKLFYGELAFDGISIDQAKAFKKFLDENNINYRVIKQEVK